MTASTVNSFVNGDNLGNHSATTNLAMNSNNINEVNQLSGVAVSSYDKLRVWNSSNYTIGMVSGQSLGYLNDYAMTFTMNENANRGFLWRDVNDAASDGAMSLTTDGRLYLKGAALLNGPIRRTDHNTGFLEGSYNNVGANSANTNPIYTIGSNYNPSTTALNNMYGIGYSHTNSSFVTDPGPDSWGMYVAADGDARIWLAASAGGSSYFNAGNVGIGTASPSQMLEVTGSSPTILVNNPAARGNAYLELNRGSEGKDRSMVVFSNASNKDWFAGTPYSCGGNTNQFTISRQDYVNACSGVTYTPEFVILANGNVGIGVSNPTYRLHVDGRIKTTGINETSDIRLKKNISTLHDGLDKVLQMRGVTYDWRTDQYPDMQLADGQQVGVIAQEIEAILPQLVSTDNEGFKSVEYSHLVPVLIEAIKELKTENDQLKANLERYNDIFSEINIEQLINDYAQSANVKK